MLFFNKKGRTEGTAVTYVPEERGARLERRGKLVLFRWAVLVFVVLLGTVAVLIKTPFLYAQKITVSGNKSVSDDAILALALGQVNPRSFWVSVLGANHFFNWPDAFPAEKLRLSPTLKNVAVEKNYGDRSVLLQVKEREPYGIWCRTPSGDSRESVRCWWFDREGTAFKKAVRAEGSLIVSVLDHSQNELGLGMPVLSERFLPNTLSVLETIRSSGLGVREIVLKELDLQEIAVKTYNGPEIYFSLRFPAENALAALPSLMAKSGFKDLDYVDFRVENRVYYR